MDVNFGDIVILTETDDPFMQAHVGKRWKVGLIMYGSHPPRAVITLGDLQTTSYLKNLEVIPPSESPFEHHDLIKIKKGYTKINHKTCDKSLIGKIGKIKGYDSITSFYYIRCNTGEFGWFPADCLVPLNFKGEHFFYPLQNVKYEDKIVIISEVKKTRFSFGQLLLIEGNWIPSTDVKPLEGK